MHLDSAKIWFVSSLIVLSFLYGAAVGKWEWFPHSVLDRAVDQARHVVDRPKPMPDQYDKFYDREGVRAPLPDDIQPGLTAITSSWRDSTSSKVGVKLLSREGNVVHQWLFDRSVVFPNDLDVKGNPEKASISSSHLLPEGDLIVTLGYVGIARLNACGDVLWTLPEGVHHWGTRADDGSFWVPGVSAERRNSSAQYPDGYPGIEKPVWLDRILNVTEDGRVRKDIYILDVLYENGLERFIPKMMASTWPSRGEVPDDITHLNDVEPLGSEIADEYPLFDAGDLLVSLRHLNLVFVFDPETLNVKWYASDPFVYQHDPDFIGDGWIGIFNNNRDLTGDGRMLGDSEIVALQPHTDSVRVLFPTEQSEPFHTFHRGTWQQLENGNMFLAETTKGRVVEVTPDGRTAWEWVHESYGSTVSGVADIHRHDFTRQQVASWACSQANADSVRSSPQ